MKDSILIYFCDFWDGFNYKDELIYSILCDNYKVDVLDHFTKELDLIIYSCFGVEHLNYYGVKKLYYSGENDYPNYNQCDYAITHTIYENERHIRVPLWAMYYHLHYKDKFIQRPNLDESYFDRKFCADVISNNNNSWNLRLSSINKIAEYQSIDHGGKLNNNVGGPVKDKIEFLSNYKFSIAFENSDVDGYVTEKIFEAYVANTIPIYLGTKYVTNEFNFKSFINISSFGTYTALINCIKSINENKEKYMSMLNASRMVTDDYYQQLCDKLTMFLTFIIEGNKIYTHKYGRIGLINNKHWYF